MDEGGGVDVGAMTAVVDDVEDWNEVGDVFEAEALAVVPLLPNEMSSGDNRSATF